MQTIPDGLLDRIVAHRPALGELARQVQSEPGRVAELERALALAYLSGGETRLTPLETWFLGSCAAGEPYGAQRDDTLIPSDTAAGTWVNVKLGAQMAGYFDIAHLYRLIRSGRVPSARRKGEAWVPRAAVERLERSPVGRPAERRAALLARLPGLKACFGELERRGLVYAISGVGNHDARFVADLAENVRIGLHGSSLVRHEGLDLEVLVAKVRALDALDREAVVRAMEFAWSRINQTEPPGVPWPHQIFDRML